VHRSKDGEWVVHNLVNGVRHCFVVPAQAIHIERQN
jgi:hypothetical protein